MTPGNRLQNYDERSAGWVESTAAQAAERVSELGHEVRDRLKAAGEDLTDLIRRHPLPTLLAGFTLGLVLARVVFARR
jgi:hypothetical protein